MPAASKALRFKLDGDRLEYIHKPSHQDGRRDFGKEDADLIEGWVDGYRKICARSGDQSNDLLNLGREIYAWLNGSEGIVERARSTRDGTPFVVEFQTPANPNGDAQHFLEAPWETLADDGGFLAGDGKLLYCPLRRLGRAADPREPSKYRPSIVFMAAAPKRGGPELNYEAEETAVLGATSRIGIDLTVEESGTLSLLADCMARQSPVDVLHIVCHGHNRPGPILQLENDEGGPAHCAPLDLARELGDHLPKLLFVSACKTGDPDEFLNSFSAEMVERGIPAVLGWGGSVSDAEAIRFAESLYGYLAKKNTLEMCLAWSRFDLLSPKGGKGEPARDWHLARLYLGARGGGVLARGDASKAPPADAGVKEFLDAKAQQVPVAGRHEFVGRRREIQKILKEFREKAHAGVLISGMGRQGKSSLAARAANRMGGLATAVVFGHYGAEDILRAMADAAGTSEVRQRVEQAIEAYRGNPHTLETSLREILQGPCRNLVKNEHGDITRRPILLVIDDFEQALKPPVNDKSLHRLKSKLVDAYCALINAFSRADTESRLLFTTRYQFTLPHQGRELAEKLLPVPLHGMKQGEGLKQAQAKSRGVDKKKQGNLTAERVARCVEMALGNPGLQDLLFSLAAEDPGECDKALAAMQQFIEDREQPEQQDVLDFLGKLVLDSLLGGLTPSEMALLRAPAMMMMPIPREAFAALGLHRAGEQPGRRLLAMGLWEEFPDPSDDSRKAVAINPLVRLKVGKLSEEEQKLTAAKLLPDLFRLWGGDDTNKRPYSADIQLTLLALLAEDTRVLSACAAYAVNGLEKQFNYRAGAALGKAAIEALELKDVAPPIWLLLYTSDLCERLGEMKDAKKYIAQAAGLHQEAGSTASDFDQGSALLRHARLLVGAGEPDKALEALEQAKSLFSDQKYARDRAITLGDIARIRVSKGQVDEALKMHQEALAVYEELGDRRVRAVTLGDIARIMVSKGQVDEALKMHQEALAVYEELGDRRSRAVTLGDIARIYRSKGQVDEALKMHQEALAVYEELGDRRSRAVTLGDIARIYRSKGQVDEALKLHQEALAVYEELGDRRSRAITLGDIAKILSAKGQVDEALKMHQERLAVYEELGDRRSRAVTLGYIARIRVSKGQVDEALKMHEEELAVYEELGDRRSRAITLGYIARIRVDKGQVDEALKMYEEELVVYEELGDRRSRAVTLGDIARIRVSKGQVDEALKMYEEILRVVDELGDKRGRAVTLGDIARIRVDKGQVDEALKMHEEELAVYEELGDMDGKANALWSIAKIDLSREDHQAAFDHLAESYAINQHLGRLDGICWVGVDLGQLLCVGGHVEEGLKVLTRSRDGFITLGQNDNARQVEQLMEFIREQETRKDKKE